MLYEVITVADKQAAAHAGLTGKGGSNPGEEQLRCWRSDPAGPVHDRMELAREGIGYRYGPPLYHDLCR